MAHDWIAVRGARVHNLRNIEVAGDRGAHLLSVERFTLNLAGLEDIERESAQLRLLPERKAQPLHPAKQTALPVPNLGQRRRQSVYSTHPSRPCGAAGRERLLR